MHIAQLEPQEAQHFVQHMDDCLNNRLHNSTLLGHHDVCYTSPITCGSKLLYLRLLASHYPNLRRIVNGLDESKVMEEYKFAMVAFKKRCIDLPEFPCILVIN